MKSKVKGHTASQLQTAYDKYKAIQDIGIEVGVPHEVKCTFKNFESIRIMGDQVTFGEDYVSISYARFAITWLVKQLGGEVKWEK